MRMLTLAVAVGLATCIATSAAADCSSSAFRFETIDNRGTASVYPIVAQFENRPAEKGTGFVIDAERGLLVTAAHVVIGDLPTKECELHDDGRWLEVDSIKALPYSGDGFELEIVDVAVCDDLALLRFVEKPDSISEMRIALRNYDDSAIRASDAKIISASHDVRSRAYAPTALTVLQLGDQNVRDARRDALCHGKSGDCYRYRQSQIVLGGESGSPLIDRESRVFAVAVRKFDSGGLALPIHHLWKLLAPNRPPFPAMEERRALAEKATRQAKLADEEAAVERLDAWRTVDLAYALSYLAENPEEFDLPRDRLACPIAAVANARMLPKRVRSLIEIRILASDVPGQQIRAAYRTVAQRYFADGGKEQIAPAARRDTIEKAQLAYGLAIKAHLSAAGDPGGAVNAIGTAAFAGNFAFRARVKDSSGGQETVVVGTDAIGVPDMVPTGRSAKEIVAAVAEHFNVKLDPQQAAGSDRVLASILREYADASLALASLSDADEAERMSRLAAGAAFWSVRLEPDPRGLAIAHRTQGDALSRLRRYQDANTAYARGYFTATENRLSGTLSRSLQARVKETCTLSRTCEESTPVVTMSTRPIAPELRAFFGAAGTEGLLSTHRAPPDRM